MRNNRSGWLAAMASLGVTLSVGGGHVNASTAARFQNGLVDYFGSQSGAYQDKDLGPAVTYPVPGIGTYPVGFPLPGLPAPTPTLPPSVPSIVYPSSGGQPLQPSPYSFVFNDGYSAGATIAKPTITDTFTTSPVFTSDIAIQIPLWSLVQSPGAIGYAYNQVNFFSEYLVNSTGIAGSTPSIPINVNGSTVGGGYAQFDAVIEYVWQPVNFGASNYASTGPAISLGTLNYSFIQPGGGTFASTITSTGTLAGIATGTGILEMHGYAYLAGDPMDITISSVPEPMSVGLLGVGLLGLMRRGQRKGAKS